MRFVCQERQETNARGGEQLAQVVMQIPGDAFAFPELCCFEFRDERMQLGGAFADMTLKFPDPLAARHVIC